MMNPNVKKLWLEALRSGEYTQAQGALCERNDDGSFSFCCLGVLCNLYLNNNPDAKGYWDFDDMDGQVLPFFANNREGQVIGVLPTEVKKWAGIEEDDPTVRIRHKNLRKDATLSGLNDDYGYNFKIIANKIEKGLR